MFLWRSRCAWLAVLLIVAGLSVGSQAATYNSVEDLPEPDVLLTDRIGDAESYGGGSGAGWADLREVRGYLTEHGVAFAVFCNGSIPANEVLLVLLDIDGPGGSVGRGLLNREKTNMAGYDFGLGYLGDVGLHEVSSSYDWPVDRRIDHWKKGKVAYFEVTWELLGGRPEAIAFLVVAEGSGVQDVAPNHGAETLAIASSACAGAPLQAVYEADFEDRLGTGWRWLREDPASWSLDARRGFVTITVQPGGLLNDGNDARNVLLRDAPAGDFEISTYVEFVPTEDFQFAGLILYGDDDNFLALGRAYCNTSIEQCVGNGIYFDLETRGALIDSHARRLGVGAAHLRIARRGSDYYGYYSDDGEEWTLIGSHTVVGFHPEEAGLYVADGGTEARDIPAAFDFFVIEAQDCNEP